MYEVPPQNLVLYLTSLKWRQVDVPNGINIAILRKTFGQNENEILIPTSRDFADFSQRIAEAINLISIYESRSREEVVDDLLSIGSDKPQQDTTQSDFVGKIKTLNGDENEQGEVEGDITLILLVNEESIKAKAFLNSKFYREACDAHKNGNYIRVSGLLKEKPRVSVLEDILGFEVISKEQ